MRSAVRVSVCVCVPFALASARAFTWTRPDRPEKCWWESCHLHCPSQKVLTFQYGFPQANCFPPPSPRYLLLKGFSYIQVAVAQLAWFINVPCVLATMWADVRCICSLGLDLRKTKTIADFKTVCLRRRRGMVSLILCFGIAFWTDKCLKKYNYFMMLKLYFLNVL